jgi:hypothetical protein
MSDDAKTVDTVNDHKFFGLWAEDEKTGKKAFVIKCECGETFYNLEKDLFQDPDQHVFPGMTIDEFQKMQKKSQRLKGMRKQIQRVALAQHAEAHPECPFIAKMKEDAGVTSIQELPNPFRQS